MRKNYLEQEAEREVMDRAYRDEMTEHAHDIWDRFNGMSSFIADHSPDGLDFAIAFSDLRMLPYFIDTGRDFTEDEIRQYEIFNYAFWLGRIYESKQRGGDLEAEMRAERNEHLILREIEKNR